MCDFVSVQRIERGRKQLFGFVRGQIHEKHDKVWHEVCRRAIRATATRGWTYGGWIGFSIVRGIFFFSGQERCCKTFQFGWNTMTKSEPTALAAMVCVCVQQHKMWVGNRIILFNGGTEGR